MKYTPFTLLILVVAACGETSVDGGANGPGTGGKPGQGANVGGGASLGTGGAKNSSGGMNSASGGALGSGGSKATGGISSGSTSSGGTSASTGGSAQAAGGAEGTPPSCDPGKIQCRIAAPVCEQGEVPSVQGICYGPCVKIDQCACTKAEQCPDPNQFTCLVGLKHCSYFLR